MRTRFQTVGAVVWFALAVILVQIWNVQVCTTGVLTHEEVVDLVWKDNLVPL